MNCIPDRLRFVSWRDWRRTNRIGSFRPPSGWRSREIIITTDIFLNTMRSEKEGKSPENTRKILRLPCLQQRSVLNSILTPHGLSGNKCISHRDIFSKQPTSPNLRWVIKTGIGRLSSLLRFFCPKWLWRCLLVKIRTYFAQNPDTDFWLPPCGRQSRPTFPPASVLPSC